MKNFNLILILILVSLANIQAQGYYSTISENEIELHIRNSFKFNDTVYIESYGDCDSLMSYEKCTIISKINSDGTITKVKNFRNTRFGLSSILVHNDKLIIASRDSLLRVRQFDSDFNEIKMDSYELPEMNGSFFIKKIIKFNNDLIVIGDDMDTEKETGVIFQISLEDSSLKKSIIIKPDLNRVTLFDIENKNDTLVLLQETQVSGPTDNYFKLNRIDNSLNIIDTVVTQVEIFRTIVNFEILNNNDLVVLNDKYPNQSVISFNTKGEQEWETLIAEKIIQIGNEANMTISNVVLSGLMKDSQGNVVICGPIFMEPNTDFLSASFIAKISEEGEILWAKIYKENYANSNFFGGQLRQINEVNEGYIFSGYVDNYPIAGEPNQFWILKTNFDGCISESCSDYLSLSIKDNLENQEKLFEILENPTQSTLSVNIENFSKMNFYLMDQNGKFLRELKQPQNGINEYDLQDLISGTYFLLAREKNGTQQIEKLIVIK